MNDSFLCPLKALANQNASYNRDHLQISLKSAENIADNQQLFDISRRTEVN